MNQAKLERSYAEESAPRERTEEQKIEILRSCMYPYPVKSSVIQVPPPQFP